MSIDLKNFVDVNIQTHVASSAIGTRSKIVLYTTETVSGGSKTVVAENYKDELLGLTETLKYLDVYFDNGGVSAEVISTTKVSLTASVIKALPNEEIVIGFVNTTEGDDAADTYAFLKSLIQALNADTTVRGINEKVILARTEVTTDSDKIKNFAVKYSYTTGAEMTIAAYLSKINVYSVDSVYDYMFTQELIQSEDLDDSTYTDIVENNMNVDVNLANAVRNCGGNMKDGEDLVNKYVLIILHQTLTDQVLSLLSQKLKNVNGLSKLYSVIAQELSRYLTCGYLTTDKIWTDSDYVVQYNNEQYTIIETGTALTDGFVISILPLTSLTDADKLAHKAPPIYIILGTQYGIRKIEITGEVI